MKIFNIGQSDQRAAANTATAPSKSTQGRVGNLVKLPTLGLSASLLVTLLMLPSSVEAGPFDDKGFRTADLLTASRASRPGKPVAIRAPDVTFEASLSCVRIFRTGVVVRARIKGVVRVQDCPSGYGLLRSFEHSNRAELTSTTGQVRYYNVVRDRKAMGRARLRVRLYPRDLAVLRSVIKAQKDTSRPLRMKSAEQRRSAARKRLGTIQRRCCVSRGEVLGRFRNSNRKFAG